MNTRLAIAALWFFAAAYAGSMLHNIAGLATIVGPAVGLLTAAVIVVDPFARFASSTSTPAARPAVRTAPGFETAPPQGALAAR